jgi:hypothetical protein
MSSAGELYSLNYLNGESNGRGNTGIGAKMNILGALMNPASLQLTNMNQAGIQYSYKTPLDWKVNNIFGGYIYTTKPLFPSLHVAYARKITNEITAGFIYSNPISVKYDFSGTPFSQDDDNQLYYNYTVHSLTIPLSYNSGVLSAGLNMNFSYHRTFIHGVTTITSPDDFTDVVSTFSRFNVQGGLIFSPVSQFSAGVTFTPGFKAYPENDLEEVSSNIKTVSKFPMRIGAGIKYTTIRNKLNLYLDYNFIQTSDLKGYKDRHDFNFGGDVIVNKNLTLRAGAFTFLDNRNFDQSTVSFPDAKGEHEQIFITLGGTVILKNIELTGSIMDSHISGGFVKVTHLNLGGVINF